MPLAVRYVEPHNPSAMPLLDAVQSNHLQALSEQNLTGVIRQLGSLAKHAEDILGEIADTLGSIHRRAVVLEERARRLKEETLPRLDPDQEVLEGFEIPHPDNQFRSDQTFGQHLFTKQTVAPALMDQILAAWSPNLHVLTPHWEDGRDAMHMFSNPDFFFEHWRINIQRETMQRRATVDMLSPIHTDMDRMPNGSIKRVKSTRDKEKQQFKRNKKLSKSFRKSLHGSTLSLQDVGGLNRGARKSNFERAYSFRAGGSLRASFRRKVKQRPRLEDLTKATAAAFEGPEVQLMLPEPTPEEEDEPQVTPEVKVKRNSFIRRSFSLRRSRSRSRSHSPNPPIPTESVLEGKPMYTLDVEKEKLETSKLATLSKHHLESLELGTSNFETCLAIDSYKKNSTTFKVPNSIQVRSVSPMELQPRRDRLLPPPKVAPKLYKMHSPLETHNADYNLPRQRSSTASITVTEVNEAAKKVFPNNGRPASVFVMEHHQDWVAVPSLTPRPSSRASLRSLQSSSSLLNSQQSSSELYTGSKQNGGVIQTRPKPRRPAPPKPTRTDSIKKKHCNGRIPQAVSNSSPSPSGPPLPPPRSDSLIKNGDENNSPPPSGRQSLYANDPPALSNTLAMNSLHTSPPLKQMDERGATIFAAVVPTNTSSVATPLGVVTSQYDQGSQPKPHAPLLKQGSLYISPRKINASHLTAPHANGYDDLESGSKLRASQILRAGGVSDGDLSRSHDDLLAAIRKGLQLKKVEKEEKEKQRASDSMPWDVAAILERRLAIESDSEQSGNEIDDGEWED